MVVKKYLIELNGIAIITNTCKPTFLPQLSICVRLCALFIVLSRLTCVFHVLWTLLSNKSFDNAPCVLQSTWWAGALVLLVTSSTVTRSHNVVSIKAWRLSRQICHAAESCHFCRELAYRGWQLRPGHRLGSPRRVSNTSPADTWSVNKMFFCETTSSHQMWLQYFAGTSLMFFLSWRPDMEVAKRVKQIVTTPLYIWQ